MDNILETSAKAIHITNNDPNRRSADSGLLDELSVANTNYSFDESANVASSPQLKQYLTENKFKPHEFRKAMRQTYKEMTELEEKGGYACELIKELKESNLDHADDLDMDVYYEVVQVLKNFIILHNQANQVNVSIKKMRCVMFGNKILEETFFGLKKIDARQDTIQKRVIELKENEIPDILKYWKIMQETLGPFIKLILPKINNVAIECKELLSAVHEQTQSISEVLNEIERKTKRSNNEDDKDDNDEVTEGIVVCHRNKVPQKGNAESEQSKTKMCRLEHNRPFCINCGWRTTWLKAFKKRGVFVKEIVDGPNKQIWINDMDKR